LDITPDARLAAESFAEELVALNVESSSFRGKLRQLETLGRGGLLASTQLCAGIAAADRSALTRRTTARIKGAARRLGKLAQGFAPVDSGAKDGYFDRFQNAETELRDALRAFAESLSAARRIALALERDIKALSTARQSLDADAAFGAALDDALAARAPALPEEPLSTLRRRRTDLLLQITVVDQALAGLRKSMIVANGLIAALDRARLETLYALRTVALAAPPLVRQAALVERVAAETDSMLTILGAAEREVGATGHVSGSDPWPEVRSAWRRVAAATAAIETV